MRDPSFFCLCPVFVVKPVVLMYKKVLRPFSTSSTETQVRDILGLSVGVRCDSGGARALPCCAQAVGKSDS